MQISSFELTADRRLGQPDDQFNLILFAPDRETRLENYVGTILGFPGREAAVECGIDVIAGDLVFFGGRVEASTVREAA